MVRDVHLGHGLPRYYFPCLSPFEVAVDRFLCTDLVVHGWDLRQTLGHLIAVDAIPDKEYTAKVTDSSFAAPNGERVQRLEIVIPKVTPQQVWEAVSTSAGLRGWVAPVTEVEMKTGGRYYTNYNPAAKIGDPGTIYNSVLTYVPLEMVAMLWSWAILGASMQWSRSTRTPAAGEMAVQVAEVLTAPLGNPS